MEPFGKMIVRASAKLYLIHILEPNDLQTDILSKDQGQ